MTKPKKLGADRFPGLGKESRIDDMLRVDHAGEYGAVRIYEGQLAVFRHRAQTQKAARVIARMARQEQSHLDSFDRLLNERRVRPTVMAPVWQMAGFALGAATALMGEKAAMACTAAVEEAIDEHYRSQEQALERYQEPDLKQTIAGFRADEAAHRRTALDYHAAEMPGYGLFSRAIKRGCRIAIKISEKI